MTHYSENPAMVRIDIFKPNGKWYTTEAIKWLTYNADVREGGKWIHDALKESLLADEHAKRWLEPYNKKGEKWIIVCLDPYHEHNHPIMIGLF